ncbi:MAG: secondary thiamine-phosphate synthase enzyme YjbQ [Alphaproteobacteria bacterium]
MHQKQDTFSIQTKGLGFLDITKDIRNWVRQSGIKSGILTLFVKHTSAGITIQENYDPDVMMDLNSFFEKISPQDASLYRHYMEGADDMPAHIRSSLVGVSLNIPVCNGDLCTGTWQGIYLCEFRKDPHIRNVVLHLIGE